MIEVTERANATWYAIQISMTQGNADQVDIWCTRNFGQGLAGIKDFPKTENLGNDECRWGIVFGRVFFRYKEDMLMFMLRWG